MSDELESLLAWRWRTIPQERRNSAGLLQALTVEGLPYPIIPQHLREAVTLFRHRNHASRWSCVTQFCARQGRTPPDTVARTRLSTAAKQ